MAQNKSIFWKLIRLGNCRELLEFILGWTRSFGYYWKRLRIRQGSGTIADDQWYHLLVSYPGDTADLNQTRIYLNGKLIDSRIFNFRNCEYESCCRGENRVNYNQTDSMNGLLDEVRLSSAVRGQAWAEYSYLNQRNSSNFLDYDLNTSYHPNCLKISM